MDKYLKNSLILDIADRIKAEQLLRQSRAQFKAAFDHVPVAMMLVNNKGIIEKINRAAARLFNLSYSDLSKKHVDELIRQGIIPKEVKIVCCPRHIHEFKEIEFTNRSKQHIFLHIMATKIKNSSLPSQWILMLEDISSVVQARQLHSTISQRILQAHEEEKLLLSREIHDSISQSLAALKMSIQSESPTAAIINQVDQLIQSTRTLSQNLRPEVIDKLGLLPALEQLAESIHQRFKTSITINASINHSTLKPEISLQLYRITQEAILNAARHGQAKKIAVCLSKRKNNLKLLIKDDGKGFDPQKIASSTKKSHSLGINIMIERAKRINCLFTLQSKIKSRNYY
jgi:PAS domain S-box-containing protein